MFIPTVWSENSCSARLSPVSGWGGGGGGGAGQACYTLGSEALRLYLELSDDAAILTSSPTLLLVQVVKPDTAEWE